MRVKGSLLPLLVNPLVRALLVFLAIPLGVVEALLVETVPEPHYGEKFYQYGYQVEDLYTGDYHGHMEHTAGHLTKGEYKVALPDGRIQVVSYEADHAGFRPRISYEPAAGPPPHPPPQEHYPPEEHYEPRHPPPPSYDPRQQPHHLPAHPLPHPHPDPVHHLDEHLPVIKIPHSSPEAVYSMTDKSTFLPILPTPLPKRAHHKMNYNSIPNYQLPSPSPLHHPEHHPELHPEPHHALHPEPLPVHHPEHTAPFSMTPVDFTPVHQNLAPYTPAPVHHSTTGSPLHHPTPSQSTGLILHHPQEPVHHAIEPIHQTPAPIHHDPLHQMAHHEVPLQHQPVPTHIEHLGSNPSSCPAPAFVPSKAACQGRTSQCWSVGVSDLDCPGAATCCYDGCANVCQGLGPTIGFKQLPRVMQLPHSNRRKDSPSPPTQDSTAWPSTKSTARPRTTYSTAGPSAFPNFSTTTPTPTSPRPRRPLPTAYHAMRTRSHSYVSPSPSPSPQPRVLHRADPVARSDRAQDSQSFPAAEDVKNLYPYLYVLSSYVPQQSKTSSLVVARRV